MASRDYQQTSSITEMFRKLRWRPLDQRRIENCLIMLYKITYGLVAIPVAEYLVSNRRESKFIHPLAYRQIQTSTNYYKFSFFPRAIVDWIPSPPALLCFLPWHSSAMLYAWWCTSPLNCQTLFYLLIKAVFSEENYIPPTIFLCRLHWKLWY